MDLASVRSNDADPAVPSAAHAACTLVAWRGLCRALTGTFMVGLTRRSKTLGGVVALCCSAHAHERATQGLRLVTVMLGRSTALVQGFAQTLGSNALRWREWLHAMGTLWAKRLGLCGPCARGRPRYGVCMGQPNVAATDRTPKVTWGTLRRAPAARHSRGPPRRSSGACSLLWALPKCAARCLVPPRRRLSSQAPRR
jgi:hypothetical protein